MFERLNLPEGASVLDAGCGIAHVALFMARRGLRVTCIDVVEHHVKKARENIRQSGLPNGQVTVRRADYHNLDWIPDASFDGIYTMETLVHATDLKTVLRGFYRILKPGGRLVEHEYEMVDIVPAIEASYFRDDIKSVIRQGAMPLDLMREGHLKETLEDIGFVDVNIRDYSENVRPMLRLFFWMAAIPFVILKILCLEKYFVNTVAGFGGLWGQDNWRYISISASKPGGPVESAKAK